MTTILMLLLFSVTMPLYEPARYPEFGHYVIGEYTFMHCGPITVIRDGQGVLHYFNDRPRR